jgi:serine/threonine protein kinase
VESLGRYVLLRRLAVGGMAEVFLAKLVGAAGFEKEVAVKRILPQWSQHKDFTTMLVDEAKIAVQLSHPNVVQVYELAREDDVYYIAMEFVPGWDVRQVMQAAAAKKARIPLDAALFIATEILEGLAYAHSRKDGRGRPLDIVHRDISPQNILLSEDGGVKITDFGIAKAASKSHETATGVLKGKFAYMSPEQASQREVDGRSDLFSTAVVFYELLTGERLFHCGSDIETLDRVRRAQVAPSPQALAAIPKPLLEVLLKALARSPEDRYEGAAAACEALRRYAHEAGLETRRDRLAGFLKTLFAQEKRPEPSPQEETRLLTEATRFLLDETKTVKAEVLAERSETRLLVDDEPVKSWPISWVVVGFALMVVTLLAYALREKEAPLPPEVAAPESATKIVAEVRAPETIPETKPKTTGSDFESPPVVALKVAKGFLSVQAVPWGTVSIDGGKRRWETPIRRLPLAAGRHTVRVAYEPDGSSLATSVTIVSGKEIVCVAKFRGGKELRCDR